MRTPISLGIKVGIFLTALLLVAAVIYGCPGALACAASDTGLHVEQDHNAELPWEHLATRWFRAVSL